MPEPFLKIEAWAFQLDEFVSRPIFHESDSRRAAEICDPARRRRYERGRSALRKVLASRLRVPPEDVIFEISPSGKPRVAGCEFSISHSGPWLVVAASDAPVGVDIEAHGRPRNALALAERFFPAADLVSLRRASEAEREPAFLRQWVAKEAAIKCDGAGLAHRLHKAECLMDKSGIRGVRWDAERFRVHEFSLPDGTPGAAAWRGDGEARIEWRDPAEISAS